MKESSGAGATLMNTKSSVAGTGSVTNVTRRRIRLYNKKLSSLSSQL